MFRIRPVLTKSYSFSPRKTANTWLSIQRRLFSTLDTNTSLTKESDQAPSFNEIKFNELFGDSKHHREGLDRVLKVLEKENLSKEKYSGWLEKYAYQDQGSLFYMADFLEVLNKLNLFKENNFEECMQHYNRLEVYRSLKHLPKKMATQKNFKKIIDEIASMVGVTEVLSKLEPSGLDTEENMEKCIAFAKQPLEPRKDILYIRFSQSPEFRGWEDEVSWGPWCITKPVGFDSEDIHVLEEIQKHSKISQTIFDVFLLNRQRAGYIFCALRDFGGGSYNDKPTRILTEKEIIRILNGGNGNSFLKNLMINTVMVSTTLVILDLAFVLTSGPFNHHSITFMLLDNFKSLYHDVTVYLDLQGQPEVEVTKSIKPSK